MEKQLCPHCNQATIKFGQKIKAGKWQDIYCDECGGRSCTQPIVLAIMYFLYVWDITFFTFMAVYEESFVYVGVMVVLALLLEFFIYYIPLSRMKKREPNVD
jgi:hypothetical protein